MHYYLNEKFLFQKGFVDSLKPYGCEFVIVTDSNVKNLYGDRLSKILKAPIFFFLAGESSKTRETAKSLEDFLFENNCGKNTCLIGLGGGTVTDITGFVASTYLRGISHIFIPTTLLAMADASVGGKTGVNTCFGKNLVGSFYQPKAIFADISTLETLSEPEVFNGTVEIIKHGLILDRDLIISLKEISLLNLIERAVSIKRSVIKEDERESGYRRILNFGHTVGHAIEVATDYSISHGTSVAIGIVLESMISHKMGFLPEEDLKFIASLFNDLPCILDILDREKFISALCRDKKNIFSKVRMVFLKKVGEVVPFDGEYCAEIDPHDVDIGAFYDLYNNCSARL